MSIKLFTKGRFRHIVIKDTIDKNSADDFRNVFSPSIDRYEITFLNIKSISKNIIDILYEAIYVKKFQIIIYTTSNKLSNYLKDININNFSLRYNDKKPELELKNIEAVVIGGSADSLENIMKVVRTIPWLIYHSSLFNI